MIQTLSIKKADTIGAVTGGLCATHCIATPFIFLVKAGTANVPEWYHMIDYLFIVISFFAVHFAAKNSTKDWMKVALWGVWVILLLAILNEAFEIMPLPEASVYIPSIVIAGLHIYNHKYCKCTDSCCSSN